MTPSNDCQIASVVLNLFQILQIGSHITNFLLASFFRCGFSFFCYKSVEKSSVRN